MRSAAFTCRSHTNGSTTSCGNMLQVYHLQHIVMSSYSFCWPQKVYHLLLVRAKARKRKWSDFMLCVVGCDHQCRILDAVCCVLCAVCCVLCAVCEFTVRCKHLTLWDLQLSPADLTPMEAPQVVEICYRCTTCSILWWAAGVPPAAMLLFFLLTAKGVPPFACAS